MLLQGARVPSGAFELFIMRPALTKTRLTVPMICTLLPQNDCIWTLICILWLSKTKLVSFYNVNSNVVETNKIRIPYLNDSPPFYRQLRFTLETEALILKCTEKFLRALQYFCKMTDNHLSKVHHTLLNVMVFILSSLQSFASLMFSF